jgi:hypothetical protein
MDEADAATNDARHDDDRQDESDDLERAHGVPPVLPVAPVLQKPRMHGTRSGTVVVVVSGMYHVVVVVVGGGTCTNGGSVVVVVVGTVGGVAGAFVIGVDG